MGLHISVTKRKRTRILRSGRRVVHTRYVLNFRDPTSGRRTQRFFGSQAEALAHREHLRVTASAPRSATSLTVDEVFEHWLKDRALVVKPATLTGYTRLRRCIIGPLLDGTPQQRRSFTMGRTIRGQLVPMLGGRAVFTLTTADIRSWHQEVCRLVSPHTAHVAKGALSAAFSLATEDFGLRTPVMPKNLGRRRKPTKSILTLAQGQHLIDAARQNPARGFYAAFSFLAGTRPSEQLGLLWEDVDLVERVISINRMKEINGSLTHFTKTPAGVRRVPMCETLHELMTWWRNQWPERLPRDQVFVCRGGGNHRPGKELLYTNFLRTYWRPVLRELGLPLVSPHSARHWFINALQSQGVEVGLVAKVVGHASPMITLSHYTQAVRNADVIVGVLDQLNGPGKSAPGLESGPVRQEEVSQEVTEVAVVRTTLVNS